MRIIICGSPQWDFNDVINDEILKCHVRARRKGEKLLVIHGDDVGPDEVINKICNEIGIDHVIYPGGSSKSLLKRSLEVFILTLLIL